MYQSNTQQFGFRNSDKPLSIAISIFILSSSKRTDIMTQCDLYYLFIYKFYYDALQTKFSISQNCLVEDLKTGLDQRYRLNFTIEMGKHFLNYSYLPQFASLDGHTLRLRVEKYVVTGTSSGAPTNHKTAGTNRGHLWRRNPTRKDFTTRKRKNRI